MQTDESKAYQKAYRESHKKESKAYQKAYRELHRKELNETSKAYRRLHKEELKEKRESHKDEIAEKNKLYRESHKEEIKEYQNVYIESHKEERKAHRETYCESHKEELKEWHKAHYEKIRDPNTNRMGSKEHSIVVSCAMRNIDIKDFDGFSNRARTHVLQIRKCIEINDWFKGSHAHHITKSIIIYIPKELHQHISHNLKSGRNMAEMNVLALQFVNGEM